MKIRNERRVTIFKFLLLIYPIQTNIIPTDPFCRLKFSKILVLDVRCRFEEQFGVKIAEFYRAMTNGEPDEFDAPDDYQLAFYKTRLSLEQKCQQRISRQPIAIQIKTAVTA